MRKKIILSSILSVIMIFITIIVYAMFIIPKIQTIEEVRILGAHRGNSIGFVENTPPAFNDAVNNDKYRFIEFDIQYTKDKTIVVYHDLDLLWLQKKFEKISDLTYEELLNISKYSIPTYYEVMDIVAGKKPLNIEFKSKGDYEEDRLLADFIISDIKKRELVNTTLFSSVSKELIYYINNKYNGFESSFNESYYKNDSYWRNRREIDTGLIFYVTESTFTRTAPWICDLLHLCKRKHGWEMITSLMDSGANYLMIHGSNIRQYQELYVSLQYDEKIVYWTFDDRMYLILPKEYKTNRFNKTVMPWWED